MGFYKGIQSLVEIKIYCFWRRLIPLVSKLSGSEY
jgi:hypothetical protein